MHDVLGQGATVNLLIDQAAGFDIHRLAALLRQRCKLWSQCAIIVAIGNAPRSSSGRCSHEPSGMAGVVHDE